MMNLFRRDKIRIWVIVAAVTSMLALLAFWQIAWAQEGPPIYEGGDAPSSFNHWGPPMTAYAPGGGPPGTPAWFPVVWDPLGFLPPTPSGWGFCHLCNAEGSPSNPSYLGSPPTCEFDADLQIDVDGPTNIEPVAGMYPPDTPDLDLSDDGVTFPSVLPHCGTATVHVTGFNGAGFPLYINAWADWNRDGDWDDGSVCGCGDAEWAVQNFPVPAGAFDVYIPIIPCHPGGDPTEPLWARVTLSEVTMDTPPFTGPPWTSPQPWIWGGQPVPAVGFCFEQGETEDYYLDYLEPPECWWDKEIWLNAFTDQERGPYSPDQGPLGVVLSDTITISETLWCNFEYDWNLHETWLPAPIWLLDLDYAVPLGTDVYVLSDELTYADWWGGITHPVEPRVPVTMTKILEVHDTGWGTAQISELVDFSPEGIEMEQPIDLFELYEIEVGDAPSSWNNWGPAPMTAYPWLGAGSANFPVVAFPPAPPSNDGYGMCHYLGPSHLGPQMPSKSLELEADFGWDADMVNNILPPADTPDQDGHDDGAFFPPAMPSCHPTTVYVEGVVPASGHVNIWADWNRDGDWNNTGLCTCAVDEWAAKNFPVSGVSGVFSATIPITPCNPVSDTDPLWARVTLSPSPLPLTGAWAAGGRPIWSLCLDDGETEDYYLEPEEPGCSWDKEVWINFEKPEERGPYAPGGEPIGVVVSDTVTISETLTCNFEYDWDLWEEWDPSVLEGPTSYFAEGVVDLDPEPPIEWLNWVGGYVAPGSPVQLVKTLHVMDVAWGTTVITETVDFSPLDIHMEQPVELWEMVEGGDAPSSHNHGLLSMTTHPAGLPANFPVVWDFDGTLGPGPGGGASAGGYYGFCHWPSPTPSFIGGNTPSYELDADLFPDQDVFSTNINPPANTPNSDFDGNVVFPVLLPHCGPTTVQVPVQNNSGGTLYLNGWADWKRDGDWEDSNLCGCGVDEWTIKDVPVPAGFNAAMQIPIRSCHPVGDPKEPLWFRLTLSEVHIGTIGASFPEFTYGGFPFSAPAAGCFMQGETEDSPLQGFDVCSWEKEVSIGDEGPWRPEEGPFTVVVSDTVNITDTFSCSFDYDWHLLEEWDPDALSLEGYDVDAASGNVLTPVENPGSLETEGGTMPAAGAFTQVVVTKTLHVDALPGLTTQVITETLDFTKIGAPVYTWDRPIVLKPYQIYVPLVMKNY